MPEHYPEKTARSERRSAGAVEEQQREAAVVEGLGKIAVEVAVAVEAAVAAPPGRTAVAAAVVERLAADQVGFVGGSR